MPRTWTDEQKRAQAEKIRRWKPWEQSTGPKTPEGKARSRYNALKDGTYTPEWGAIRRALKLNKAFLEQALSFHVARDMLAAKRAVKDSDY